MLSRQHRLASSADIRRVQKQGKTLNTSFFRIKTAPNTLGHARVTIIIPNKFAKSIVARNRKRRQIAAIVRELHGHIAPFDIIIAPNQEAMAQDASILREDLIAGLTKIRLLNP